jgi:hypothetical protein
MSSAGCENTFASRQPLSNNVLMMAQLSFQTERNWPGVHPLEAFTEVSQPRGGYNSRRDPKNSNSPKNKGMKLRFGIASKEMASHQDSIVAHGHLEIPDVRARIPELNLRITMTETDLIIETDPTNRYLKLRIELPIKNQEETQVRKFHLEPSDKTVEGGVIFSRAAFALTEAGRGLLYVQEISEEPLSFDANPLSELKKRMLLYRAKTLRKLQYIQDVFNVRFMLPDLISSEEANQIEIVFRGITEGEFSTRSMDATFLIDSQDINLDNPPFSGIGQFDAGIGNKIELFGQQLSVGPMSVHLERAELANPRVVDQVLKGSDKSIAVRFEVLDNQMRFRFENYAQIPKEDLVKRLEDYKQQLLFDEPRELADSVTSFLANDVSSFEASQIAVGWQFYNGLPDRFCPQEPELDEAAGQWHVPIWLVYTGGEGGLVGALIIDKKTGAIISHTPIEEILSKGMGLAEKILHA